MHKLSQALDREIKQRESQKRLLEAEIDGLCRALAALDHRLETDPQIALPDGTRKEQLAEIIKILGGEATRQEINATAEKAGIPLGTVASILGSKGHRRFFVEKGGRWSVASSFTALEQPLPELVEQQ